MKKIILIPDSFKGSMSSVEICNIMREQIAVHYPGADIVAAPVADGGEGSVDCFLYALPGQRVEVRVKNPLFEDIDSFYGLIDGGETAVIEMAACAGLPLIENRKDPLGATTYGVGEIIVDAAKRGVGKIIVGLGGSATNDAGCGAACAAGVRFYNRQGESFIPTGGTLGQIARIDTSGRDKALDDIEIITICDIDNPLHGPAGAAFVFAPQKGASPEQVELLDSGLEHFSKVASDCLGMELGSAPGAGAAGGMGAGMLAFFSSKLTMGIDVVLDTIGFDEMLKGADMVLTGEGRIDEQSLRGKVVIGVARKAKLAGVPVVAVVGDIGEGIHPAYEMGVSYIISINRVAVGLDKARERARRDLALSTDNFMRFCKRMGM